METLINIVCNWNVQLRLGYMYKLSERWFYKFGCEIFVGGFGCYL